MLVSAPVKARIAKHAALDESDETGNASGRQERFAPSVNPALASFRKKRFQQRDIQPVGITIESVHKRDKGTRPNFT